MSALRTLGVAAVFLPLMLLAQGGKDAGIDDAAIVGIFDAANTWDISTGALAAKKGHAGRREGVRCHARSRS